MSYHLTDILPKLPGRVSFQQKHAYLAAHCFCQTGPFHPGMLLPGWCNIRYSFTWCYCEWHNLLLQSFCNVSMRCWILHIWRSHLISLSGRGVCESHLLL